ncbi:hypothetical protein GE09DRAFT_1241222 [Coniochaeta sp. 2T2.1]|nr:hypothetical protein GE09DRAFT_1241222 [Coniochaeta sp. 2T2.1]
MAYGVDKLGLDTPLSQFLLGCCLLLGIALSAAYRLKSRKKEAAPTALHLLQFPPSRRYDAPCQSTTLPTTRAQDLSKDDQYTLTGFSTQEIRALGRFPDYSVLSGVRHPRPVDPSFELSKATFRPFRPFRWNYHRTMSLMKFDPDWWVELERNYHQTMAARHDLLRTHPDNVRFDYPGSELASRELMEMLLQFLTTRYPQYFSLTNDNTTLHNRLLNTTSDLLSTPPLKVIFDNIPEDYALMLRNEDDSLYYLRAARVCSSVGWDIGQHRNKPLAEIHAPLPDFKERLAFSMDRFFARMPADQPFQRCSWSLEDHAPLFSRSAVAPDWTRSAFAANPEALAPEDVRLRWDWQTLRRLPLSGAIVFNFKAVFCPFTDLREEAYVPALLLKVLREGKEDLITYKCVDHVRRVAMAALEVWAREQVEAGVVPEGWEVGTLDESPFFPGWEEVWRRRQGV